MISKLQLHKKTFHQLTVDELYELLRVRSEVFVVEQNCVYQDMDGDDQKAIHLWLTVADKVVALARVCPAGTHMEEVSIGRVIRNSYPAMIIKTDWLELLPYKSLDIKGEDYPKMIDCEDLLDSGKFQKQ